MNINNLRYSLFGIAGGQEVDRNIYAADYTYETFCFYHCYFQRDQISCEIFSLVIKGSLTRSPAL